MHRIILAVTVALAWVLASGVVAPTAPRAHAQVLTPTVSVTPSTVVVGGTATVQGTGFTPNNVAFAYWQRPDGTTNGIFVFTNPSGSFAFRLGFLPRHGTGSEFVSAFDFGTARWAPFFMVTVTSGAPPPTTEFLAASPNPVLVGSATLVKGYAFSPNNTVFVQWRRPDGTTNAIFVFTDATGYFTFQLGFLRIHGCGTETLQAFDFGTRTFSAPYAITVTGC